MNKTQYVEAILRKTGFDKSTRARLRTDLETDLDAQLATGQPIGEVIWEMGTPQQVAAGLRQNMPGAKPQRSPWRWVFLAVGILVLLAALTVLLAQHRSAFNSTASIAVIGSADGPTAVFVTSSLTSGLRTLVTPLAFAVAYFGAFFLLQWQVATRPARFLILGVVMLVLAVLFPAVAMQPILFPPVGSPEIPAFLYFSSSLERLVSTAFWAPLVVGVLALRTFWLEKKQIRN